MAPSGPAASCHRQGVTASSVLLWHSTASGPVDPEVMAQPVCARTTAS
ncbi:hypothetical protein FM114_07345 [Luteococcus japonicus LSP_Lj1]|uniref:Uncharacterized protein n=1 Tax=Luteococcus japonicus LSP_Lj1 TaxID=1255658 RepID=A0A1R4JG59_9ACTN|nr:hypothetical protein FM114_07345 [Luteococcus japonicus LSP_Lj1]